MSTEQPMHLADLQALAAQIPLTREVAQRQQLLRQCRDAATRYVQALFVAGGQQVTDELLEALDALYDVSGMPSRLAAALNWRLRDLQAALARTVVLTCADCGTTFPVVELRKLGGYTPDPDLGHDPLHTACPSCRRQAWAETNRAWQQQTELRLATTALRASADQHIRIAPNPLRLASYREYLQGYLACWTTGVWTHDLWDQQIPDSTFGCMICGDTDVHVWVTLRNRLDARDRFVALVSHFDELASEGGIMGVPVPELDTYHQALWRIRPENYYAYLLTPPLAAQPLLCLCHVCGWVVETTHICLTPPPLDERPLVSTA